MIFEGRPLDEIRDEEIAHLVDAHFPEQQHLEFKRTFNDHKDDAARLKLLRTIAALANGGGGYLIVGIHDDGSGRAKKFVDPALMPDADRIRQSIRSLCHDHIAARIDGLEVACRVVNGHELILVRIPISARRPHMVTFRNRTDFFIRLEDGKREMSLAEIREAFVDGPVERRLDGLERRFSDLARALMQDRQEDELAEAARMPASDGVPRAEDGNLLAKAMRRRFETEAGDRPFLWLGATPVAPQRGLIDVDRTDILSNPPGSRSGGWNMAGLDHARRRSLWGLELGDKGLEYLEVFENGHLEFRTPLDGHFCWRQSEEERLARPRLYPYPVVEYPVSFLRLTEALLQEAGYTGEVLIQLQYWNVAGYILRPGQPDEIRFLSPRVPSTPIAAQHIKIGPTSVPMTFSPDEVAFGLLTSVYRAFEIGPEGIPFRNSAGMFSFE